MHPKDQDPENHSAASDRETLSSPERRDLMKLMGAGALVSSLPAGKAAAQQAPPRPPGPPPPYAMRNPGDVAPFTGTGYKNDYNRLGQNGPMDDTTQKIVKWVHGFKESDMTPAAISQFNLTMVDSLAAIFASFEEEPVRIAANLATLSPAGKYKCTVLGYGVETTPELATFANGVLIRCVDFNDSVDTGNHVSTLIPAAMAIGEAFHCTGAQVRQAISIGYELASAPAGGESVVAAMVAGRLMGLDEDRLANALTIALTPHVALNKGVGAMSMWKGVRSAESAKCGVWAAMMAHAGMTGPPQPFEGRGGLWSTQGIGTSGNGIGREFTLPLKPVGLAMERNWFKRRPAEAGSQEILVMMPEIRSWVKPEEIASIHWDTPMNHDWEEICDAPKWDPRNRETADHSLPYIIARALIDGDIYLDSFTEEKFMDPVARALMDKTTVSPVLNGWISLGSGRMTITKKSGESKYWDAYRGIRAPQTEDYPSMNAEQIKEKFYRVSAYRHVANTQRDQAYKVWSDIGSLKDFKEAVVMLAKFGQPKPL